ncbi:MAG: helix-turn-helix domain-containing protein, partial [Pseudomonadota bacterium]
MASDTREQFLDTAEALFAERGFYGVSIAAIADELDLTKQALLHHFGTKEKLYGAVLQRISDEFERQLAGITETERNA